jgi:hypothetical protein
MHYKSPGGYEYFGLVSTGKRQYEYKCGVHQNAEKSLFGKEQWVYYDHEAQSEVVVWENGRSVGDRADESAAQGYTAGRNGNAFPASMNEVDPIDPDPNNPDHSQHSPKVSKHDPDAEWDAIPAQAESLINDTQRKTMHALGMACYGTKQDWDVKRKSFVAAIARKTGRAIESSNDLKEVEARLIIKGLEDKLQEKVFDLAIRTFEDALDLDDYIRQFTKGRHESLTPVRGVELTKMYKNLQELQPA